MGKNNEAKIKFTAETKDATDGIKSLNSDLTVTRSELKLNSTQLATASDKTNLLKERQALLATELEKSKSKVELSSEKLEKAKAIYGENSEEVKKLTTQLNNAKIQEQSIANEIEKTNTELNSHKASLESVGKSVDNFGKSAESAGKKMSVVSAGIAAIGAASVASAMELDKGYDIIVTKTGASGEALEEFKKVANDVYTTLPTDIETVGSAVGEINTRFKVTGDVLNGLTTEFVKFSDINKTDVSTSVAQADKIMTAWNVDISHTGDLLGLITKKGQDTGISVDVLMSAVLDNNAVFKEMGLTLEQSINLVSQFEENGVDSAIAMAGLKKAVLAYTKEGKTMEQGLSSTIDSIKNAKTETEALSIAQDIFGKKGAVEMAHAIREGRLSVDDLSASMSDYGTVVTDTFEATLDPWDDAAVAANKLKVVGEDLGTEIFSTLTPIIEGASKKVAEFSSWFTSLNSEQKQSVIVIAGIVAVIGPALIIVGKIAQGVGVLTSVITKMRESTVLASIATKAQTVAQGALNVIMSLNPIALVVIAIVALIAAFVLLWNNCEWFRNFWIGLWEGIQSVASNVTTELAKFFSTAWENIKTTWSAVSGFFSGIWDGIASAFNGVVEWFTNVFNSATAAIHTVIDPWIEIFRRAWELVKIEFAPVGEFFAGIWTGIQTAFSTAVTFFNDTFTAAWGSVQSAFASVGTFFSNAFTSAEQGVQSAFAPVGSFFAGIWAGIQGAFSNVTSWFTNVFSGAWNAVKNVFSTGGRIFDGIKDGIAGVFKTVVNGLIGGINKVISIPFNAINSMLQKMREVNILGVTPFSWINTFSVPQIPLMAKGGIFNRATLNIAGEAGPEAITPIDKLQGYISSAVENSQSYTDISALVSAVEDLANRAINLDLNGRRFATATASDTDNVNGRRLNLRKRGVAIPS